MQLMVSSSFKTQNGRVNDGHKVTQNNLTKITILQVSLKDQFHNYMIRKTWQKGLYIKKCLEVFNWLKLW